MNMNKKIFLTLCILVYTVSQTVEAIDSHISTTISTDLFLSVDTIQKAMQDPYFATEILPNDFSYLWGLLTFGKNSQQPLIYARSVFKLFGNTIKGSDYINAYAFSDLITHLIEILQAYMRQTKQNGGLIEYDVFKKEVNSLLYTKFSTEYDNFKKDPSTFLETLSGDIAFNAHQELTVDQLRMQVIRFLELAISKLVWSPQECNASWDLVKKISTDLAQLVETNIIADINDLDDIYWSLVHRYSYFMRIFTDTLPDTFYREIRHEINNTKLVLFDLDVKNGGISESKFAHLNRILFESEARSKAIEKGVLVG